VTLYLTQEEVKDCCVSYGFRLMIMVFFLGRYLSLYFNAYNMKFDALNDRYRTFNDTQIYLFKYWLIQYQYLCSSEWFHMTWKPRYLMWFTLS